MKKIKVQVEYANGKKHTEEMDIEEYVKFKNYNENKENVEDIRIVK